MKTRPREPSSPNSSLLLRARATTPPCALGLCGSRSVPERVLPLFLVPLCWVVKSSGFLISGLLRGFDPVGTRISVFFANWQPCLKGLARLHLTIQFLHQGSEKVLSPSGGPGPGSEAHASSHLLRRGSAATHSDRGPEPEGEHVRGRHTRSPAKEPLVDLLTGPPLCCSEIPGCWAKADAKRPLPTHPQALATCTSLPIPSSHL